MNYAVFLSVFLFKMYPLLLLLIPDFFNFMTAKQHRRNDTTQQLFAAPAPSDTVRIEFDGGTSCNIPRLGYGIGYGSYRINDRPIVRVNLERAMSANAAEVWTLVRAIREIGNLWFLPNHKLRVEIHGDSKIALARCHKLPKPGKFKGVQRSGEFLNACGELRRLCDQFAEVTTHWRGRAASVALFGH